MQCNEYLDGVLIMVKKLSETLDTSHPQLSYMTEGEHISKHVNVVAEEAAVAGTVLNTAP